LRLGRPGEALEDFRAYAKLIEKGPTAARGTALNFRGLALATLGRLEEALADFNQALALRQDSPEIWSNRAYCRFLGKDPDGAIADYRQGLELWRQQGVLYATQGDSAWSFLRRIAEVHTDKAKRLRGAGDEAAARLEEELAAAASAEAEGLKKRAGLPP
jgi:tetratricopeptide (TPR) repeat protein